MMKDLIMIFENHFANIGTLTAVIPLLAVSRHPIDLFSSSQRTIGVLLINCSRSGMFYCTLWYVLLYVVVYFIVR